MKKMMSFAAVLTVTTGLFSFANGTQAEVTGNGFSVGKQYENGGYEVQAQQPVSENWSFNSSFTGTTHSNSFKKYLPFKKTNVYQNIIDTEGNVYTIESGTGANSNVVAYDKHGAKKWSYVSKRGAKELVLGTNDTLYFRDYGTLVAVNKNDGSLLWQKELEGSIGGSYTSVTIDKEGTIYTNALKEIYAYNQDGTLKWKKTLSQNINSYIKIDKEGRLFFTTDRQILALQKDGEVAWTKNFPYPLTNDKTGNMELTENEQLVLSVKDNEKPALAVLSRTNGDVTKKVALETTPTSVTVSDVDNSIYVAGEKLNVYNKDLSLKWTQDKKVGKVLLDKNNHAYATVNNDGLYSFDSEGKQVWVYQPTQTVHNWTSNLAINNEGKVFAGLRETNGTVQEYSLLTVGDDVVRGCDRMGVLLQKQLNDNAPAYEFGVTPFYKLDLCNASLTLQFEGDDASILEQKDKHIQDTQELLKKFDVLSNHAKLIWKDVKNNQILHEESLR